MKSSALRYLLLSVMVFGAAAYADDTASTPSPFKFEFHGFVGATVYVQSNPDFNLNGQGPVLLKAQNNGTTAGIDVRQTRFNFTVTGPQVDVLGAATPKAVIEADFFGLNGAGSYGEVSAIQRLRLAYGELNWGNTWVHFGQDWQLLNVNNPTSLGHVTYPVTWYAGEIGWREPSITLFHKFSSDTASVVEGALQITKADWINPAGFGSSSSTDQDVDAGELSGLPGVEARLKWSNDHGGQAYVAGHWNRVDGTRNPDQIVPGTGATIPDRTWDVMAAKIGGKYLISDFTFVGEAFYGKNTAPLFGASGNFNVAHDIHDGGVWLQAGYNITSVWSVWAVGGTDRSKGDDVVAAGGGAFANTVFGGMLQYRVGGFGFGPEIYHVETKSTLPAGVNAQDGIMDGMQYMLSANYYF